MAWRTYPLPCGFQKIPPILYLSFARSEQQRRKDVQRWQAFVKVMFNDKEVSRTLTK
jgi:hypothetical protein